MPNYTIRTTRPQAATTPYEIQRGAFYHTAMGELLWAATSTHCVIFGATKLTHVALVGNPLPEYHARRFPLTPAPQGTSVTINQLPEEAFN